MAKKVEEVKEEAVECVEVVQNDWFEAFRHRKRG